MIAPDSTKSTDSSEVLRVMRKIGYSNGTKLTDTLQGSIWKIYNSCDTLYPQNYAVLKITSKYLHQRSSALIAGKEIVIQENILNEQRILKYATYCKSCPKSIVKFHRFFHTNTDYYLLMEYGGVPLFHFVQDAHKLIADSQLKRSQWIKIVEIIFKQMTECIAYLHSKRVCHFDISLENFVINNVFIEKEKNKFKMEDIQVKLCDFGLAEFFDENMDFQSTKYCGKTPYKSPEVVSNVSSKTSFDATKNDIWSLGVCLFMLLYGLRPWKVAGRNDNGYKYVMRHSIIDLLKQWNIYSHQDEHMLCLLNSIFRCESDRICLQRIIQYIQ